MKRMALLLVCLACPTLAFAQAWSGIVDPSRAIDWTVAGVTGGIPDANWTQSGSTIAAGASASTIQTALNGCGTNHFVLLGPGNFSLTTGLTIPSNCALRGSGANSTKLTFTGSAGYYWGTYLAGFIGNYDSASDNGSAPGFAGCAGTCTKRSWTGTNGSSGVYTKGATVINLASAPTGLSVGMMIELVQNDDAAPTSGFFVCADPTAHCSREGEGFSYFKTSLRENHKVTAINGTAVTLQEPISADAYRTSQSPIAYYQACCETRNAGLENLAIVDGTTGGICGPISAFQSEDVWVSGVSIQNHSGDRTGMQLFQSTHITVQNSWVGTMNGGGCSSTTSYGIEPMSNTYLLLLNNIFDRVESPILIDGQTTGNVVAYNYINKFSGGETGILAHDVGTEFMLWEGNEVTKLRHEIIHGNHNFTTEFRNFSPGVDESAVQVGAYNRFFNLIGNVIGNTSGQANYTAAVPSTCGNCDRFSNNMYRFGYPEDDTSQTGLAPGNVVADTVALTTAMRWGNYDTINAAVRFVNSEVPTGLAKYANAVPASQTLPASFYFSSKPSFFTSSKAWPLIGPDVTGGNITGYAGHANTTPAHDCFTAAGGAIGSFNPVSCYQSSMAPTVSLSTSSVNFFNQLVGTTSSIPIVVVLTNTGNATLALTSISASGDFAQSNNCGASLGASLSCNISTTFSPTVLGPRSGSVTIVDNAAGSPHVISLSGTGTNQISGSGLITGTVTIKVNP